MGNLKMLWGLMRMWKWRAVLNIGFNLLSSLFSVFSLLMLIPFLQVLFYNDREALKASSLPEVPLLHQLYEAWLIILDTQGQQSALWVLCISLVIAFFLKNAFRFLALFVLVPLRTGAMMRLRSKIYHKLLALDFPFFQRTRRGDVLTRFGQDVQEVEYGIVNFIEVGLKEPASIVITLVGLIWMSPLLTLWVAVLLPASAFIIGRLGKMLKRQSLEAQKDLAHLQGMVDELMHGFRIIRSLGASTPISQRFESANQRYRQLHTNMLQRKELASPLSEVLGITVVAILLMIGGRWVLQGEALLSPEVFITYIVVFSQIISPAKAFANAWYFIQKGIASLERIYELTEVPVQNLSGSLRKTDFLESIEVRGLGHSFGDQTALQGLNFSVKKGEKIAITGPSGSGKTTLLNLLSRFYEIQVGTIIIDGIDICHIHQDDFHRLYAVVTQEPILFYGSVRENLLMARMEASEDEMWKALHAADASSFVLQMPEQLNTPIGERGVQLSGGQQQRLALARAWLRGAPILLLDEATAALDSGADLAVREALKNLAAEKTVIAVAHRLSSVVDFDRILLMDHGRIIAEGTHVELLQQSTLYRELASSQQV
jgi:ATP-binding cassette, subfamily B, bacterial MsbA